MAESEGQILPWPPPSSLAIDFGPLQRRNKREILGNILNCSPRRMLAWILGPAECRPMDPLVYLTTIQLALNLKLASTYTDQL